MSEPPSTYRRREAALQERVDRYVAAHERGAPELRLLADRLVKAEQHELAHGVLLRLCPLVDLHDRVELLVLIGYLARTKLGDLERAIDAYEAAQRICPSDSGIRSVLEEWYREMRRPAWVLDPDPRTLWASKPGETVTMRRRWLPGLDGLLAANLRAAPRLRVVVNNGNTFIEQQRAEAARAWDAIAAVCSVDGHTDGLDKACLAIDLLIEGARMPTAWLETFTVIVRRRADQWERRLKLDRTRFTTCGEGKQHMVLYTEPFPGDFPVLFAETINLRLGGMSLFTSTAARIRSRT